MTKYNKYIKDTNSKCIREFKMSMFDLIEKPNKTIREREFIEYFKELMPVGNNPCTINRISWLFEDTFKSYIDEYRKAAKEMDLLYEHVDRSFLEKKFLGLGSPKLDKVSNTKKENLEIPAEWLKVITRPDGSWKKIVFYNTSVSALLHHDEKMLRKMESVFEMFKKNQE